MIKIQLLDPQIYKKKKLLFQYETPGYYDLVMDHFTFQFVYKEFEQVQVRSFEDSLLEDWLEAPVLFGAFADGNLAGIVEGSIESWNNRFRISNLLVFEEYRKQGIGTLLLEHITEKAGKMGARMVILETQSCNVAAIHCYRENGFQIIGFDSHAYSNQDIEKHEVRIEMGKVL